MAIKKIFMPCAFTWGNKGDAALLIAAAQALRQQWPDAEVSFSSFTPELDSGKYGERFVGMPINPVGKLNWIIHWIPALSPILLGLTCLLVYGYLSLRRLLGLSRSRFGMTAGMAGFMDELQSADLVVAMPGGYLQATVWNDDYWLLHWLSLMIAKRENKPVIIYAQSVGPFVGLHAWFAKTLLHRLDLIMVREKFSAKRMEELEVPQARVVVVPDAAFGLRDLGTGRAEIEALVHRVESEGKPLVGVSVRNHHFPGEADPKQSMEKYLNEVARTADYLVEQLGAKVFFVPQCIGIGGNDLSVSQEVLKRMRRQDGAEILREDLSPVGLQSFYSRLHLLIGTRMHANILALCAGTPVVAISYERKTDGIMHKLGLQGYVVDIAKVEGKLLETVKQALAESGNYRQSLARAIPEIRQEALKTPQFIAERFGV